MFEGIKSMRDMSCRIVYNNGLRGAGVFLKKDAYYWLDSRGRMHERTSYGINKLLLIWLVAIFTIVLISICGYIVFTKFTFATVVTEEEITKDNERQVAVEKDIQNEIAVKVPPIGERCSHSYLTNEEIRKIYEQEGPDQLQFYINLMYARHGQIFRKGSKNDLYFNQQEWYQKLEKGTVCYEDLNDFEKKNVDLLSAFLKKEGYRK